MEEKLPMGEQQAILIIQTHERARQGRLRAQFMKEIRSMKDKNKPVVTGKYRIPLMSTFDKILAPTRKRRRRATIGSEFGSRREDSEDMERIHGAARHQEAKITGNASHW